MFIALNLIIFQFNLENNDNFNNFLVKISEILVKVLEEDIKSLQELASLQNHQFFDENIDVIVDEISSLLTSEKKLDVLEELFYCLDNDDRDYLFNQTDPVITL